MSFDSDNQPGRTARLVAGVIVALLLAAIVLHLFMLPREQDPELESDDSSPDTTDSSSITPPAPQRVVVPNRPR
jgi:hypothetical protein